MKTFFKILAFYFCASVLIPALAVCLSSFRETSAASPEDITVKAYFSESGTASDVDLEEYLKGVVAAEMPAAFEDEALKAQAVAARTYIMARIAEYEKSGYPEAHKGAAVCDDPSHCAAHLTEEKLREKWGADYDKYMKKISKCVEDTAGVIICCDSKPICAAFHSASSGITESAQDVWGSSVPYLASVKSEGDELSPKYSSSVQMSRKTFEDTVREYEPNAVWQEGEGAVSDVVRSGAGGIISIKCGSCQMSGSSFRALFELNSANADVAEEDGNITINVLGNGHGVGMSQYGANYLAKQGFSYDKILTSYYTGVTVEKMQNPSAFIDKS